MNPNREERTRREDQKTVDGSVAWIHCRRVEKAKGRQKYKEGRKGGKSIEGLRWVEYGAYFIYRPVRRPTPECTHVERGRELKMKVTRTTAHNKSRAAPGAAERGRQVKLNGWLGAGTTGAKGDDVGGR